MIPNSVLQITRLPVPVNEEDRYLRSQVSEFLNWIDHIIQGGQNTDAQMRYWFNVYSKKNHYSSRKKAYVRRTLTKVLSENPFENSEVFLEQFQ